MPLTRDQQVAYLRRFGEVWPLKSIAIALGAIAAACVYLFSQSTQEQLRVVALFVAGVSGLVAVAIAMDLPGWSLTIRSSRDRFAARLHGDVYHSAVPRSGPA
jgi:xanthine/uracil permease